MSWEQVFPGLRLREEFISTRCLLSLCPFRQACALSTLVCALQMSEREATRGKPWGGFHPEQVTSVSPVDLPGNRLSLLFPHGECSDGTVESSSVRCCVRGPSPQPAWRRPVSPTAVWFSLYLLWPWGPWAGRGGGGHVHCGFMPFCLSQGAPYVSSFRS